MSTEFPELSSISSALDELTARITALAAHHDRPGGSGGDEEVAAELYEIERSLRAASRRLGRLVQRGT